MEIPEFYVSSTFFRETRVELDQPSGVQNKKSVAFKITSAASFCHRREWISGCSFKAFPGNPQASTAHTIVTTFLGLVIGAIFCDLTSDPLRLQNF